MSPSPHNPDCLHCEDHNAREERLIILESIPKILTSMNRIIGYLTMVTVVVIAGFVYIRDVSQQVELSRTIMRNNTQNIAVDIQKLSAAMARTEERDIAHMHEFERLNLQLKESTVEIKNMINIDKNSGKR